MTHSESPSLYIELLQDVDQMLAVYDQSTRELIEAVEPEGYFGGFDAGDLVWPTSKVDGIGLEGLQKRARLVNAI